MPRIISLFRAYVLNIYAQHAIYIIMYAPVTLLME